MSESAYLLVFGDNADAFFRYAGVDEDYRASGRSLFTAETHLRHLREARAGDRLRLTLQVLGLDATRLHIAHEMRAGDDLLVSTAEQLLLHVDARAGECPVPRRARRRSGRGQGRARGAAGPPLRRPLHRRPGRPVNSELTAEQRLIVDTVRDFVERELYPHEDEVERLDQVPAGLAGEIRASALAAGLYAANMPAELGGGGLDPRRR